ncbi:anthranilate synthase alpha subunit 1, chloroplastic-like [Wolffia australiana]
MELCALSAPPWTERFREFRDMEAAIALAPQICLASCNSRRLASRRSSFARFHRGSRGLLLARGHPTSCRAELSPPRPGTLLTGIDGEAARFAEAARSANIVAISRRIFCDYLSPVQAYRCLVKEDETDAPSFLFESVNQGSKGPNAARFSIVGANPAIEIVAKENMVTVIDHDDGKTSVEHADDPTAVPRRIMENWNSQSIDALPDDVFCGGLVGYFSYDTVRYVERKKLPFSKAPVDDRNLPDIHLGLYNNLIVFDHVEKKAHVIHWVRVDRFPSIESAYTDGKKNLNILMSKLQNVDPPKLSPGRADAPAREFRRSLTKPTMSPETYKNAVRRAKEHIMAGDIYQIVLSQRFERRTFAHPFEVYRSMRVVNPSPYMTYLQARGCTLVASSPDMLLRVKKGKFFNRALAGTARRGRTEEEDLALEQKMVTDEKERAEHIMIVDLGRNDVGRVSKFGTVQVEDLMNVDRYSHVMHMRSTVTGELREGATCWDALHASMPVGTVTGVPKVRAMELIDELEVTRRGPYSGGFGGVTLGGDMELGLALRTIVFLPAAGDGGGEGRRRREWVAHLQAGAGIVADSDPDSEQRECENKAAAPSVAIDLAEAAFLSEKAYGL